MPDPGAEGFSHQKTGLKRELNLPVWLSVMRVHVAFACIAMAAGLINFSARLRKCSYYSSQCRLRRRFWKVTISRTPACFSISSC